MHQRTAVAFAPTRFKRARQRHAVATALVSPRVGQVLVVLGQLLLLVPGLLLVPVSR